jgi:hypothetical protein
VQEVYASIRFYGATEGWVVTTSTFTNDAAQLAQSTGVRLVEGARLLNLPELLLENSGESARTEQVEIGASSHAPPNPEPQIETAPAVRSEPTPSQPQPHETPLDLLGSWRRSLPAFWSQVPRQVTLGFIVAAVLAASGMLYLSAGKDPTEQLKHSAQELLARWTTTLQAGDLARHMDCYAAQVTPYFRRTVATKSEITNDKARSLRLYPIFRKYSITNLTFEALTPHRIILGFDKEWDAAGHDRYAGKEHQRIELRLSEGRWRITGEEEQTIYWVRKNGKLLSLR